MNQFQLFTQRRFLPLFLVQFLGAFNDNVFRFALIIFITFSVADSNLVDARSLVAISGGIFILPFFLFSSLAGQIADKFEKSALIRHLKFIEILVVALAAVGFWLGNTGFLLFVLFLMGTQSTFFGPLKYAVLPQHLSADELTGGNGIFQMGTYVAILLGGTAGGMLASTSEIGLAPLVTGLVAIAVAGWMCARSIPEATASDPTLVVSLNLPLATWRLLRHVIADKTTLTLVITISWFWFVGATFLSMVPTYGAEMLNADERAVTLLNLAFTIGIGMGSLMCESLSRRKIELGLVPFGCVGISIFAADIYLLGAPVPPTNMLTITTIWTFGPALRVFIDLTFIGAFGALYIVPLYAALQARSPAQRRSRVIAALNITNALFMVLSALFTVVLYRFEQSIPQIFGYVAGMNIAVMVLASIALPEFGGRLKTLILHRSK